MSSSPARSTARTPAGPPASLRAVRVLAARELSSLFDSAIAPVTLVTFVLATTTLFLNEFFLVGRLELAPFFHSLPAFYVLFAPAVSMRLWAEDRRLRTLELLVTLPVNGWVLALGKLVAAWSLLALALLGTTPLAILLVTLGDVDLGPIVTGYLGAWLLGATLVAIGSLVSAMARDQLVAFLGSALAAGLFVGLGRPEIVAVLDGLAPDLGPGSWLRAHLSLVPPFERWVQGYADLGALLQLGGLSLVALALHPGALRGGRT